MRNVIISVLALVLILSWAGLAQAKRVYVSDSFEITLRTGPSNQNKIVGILPSDMLLTVQEENEGWYKVTTPDGREGWVLQRYTSTDLPKALVITRLRRANEKLETQAAQATEKAAVLSAENEELKSSLASTSQDLSQTRQEYTQLRTDASSVIELKKNYEETTARLEEVTSRLDEVTAENKELRTNTSLIWFLSGGGVVVGCWLVGFIMGRVNRKRKARLYS